LLFADNTPRTQKRPATVDEAQISSGRPPRPERTRATLKSPPVRGTNRVNRRETTENGAIQEPHYAGNMVLPTHLFQAFACSHHARLPIAHPKRKLFKMHHTTLQPSRCPCHPEETRDERFRYLDMLIQAGWGSVPMNLIEKRMQSNGGVLPTSPPTTSEVTHSTRHPTLQ
jgi:hypothetical protein